MSREPLYDLVIAGAGPAGCMAAFAASEAGCRVLVLEAGDMVARKVCSTGNGRCNLANRHLDASCYRIDGHTADAELPELFSPYSPKWLLQYLEDLGLYTHERGDYVYPRSDQASAVAAFFDRELKRRGIRTVLQAGVTGFAKRDDPAAGPVFMVRTSGGREFIGRRLIVATGGMAAPQTGGSDSGLRMIRAAGLTVHTPYPALVPLLCDDRRLKSVAGVRCTAKVRLFEKGKEEAAAEDTGELQLLGDRLSGIPVFQISAQAGAMLRDGAVPEIRVDFLPDLTEETMARELSRRMELPDDLTLQEVFLGLVHEKILRMLLMEAGLQAEMKKKRMTDGQARAVLQSMKDTRFFISGTDGYEKAQLMAGGAAMEELDRDLMSRKLPGLYIAGELCDVNGICGGYNLQWAMISGYRAGRAAAAAAIAATGQMVQ